MKQRAFTLVGFSGLLFTTACHKSAPVAARPPDTTPVATAVLASPATPRSSGALAAPSRPVAQTPRSTTMTPSERATLNERLARLEDALFDYDRAAIRTDASTILKDDVGDRKSVV